MWIPRVLLIAAVAPLAMPVDMPKGIFHGTMVSFEGSTNSGVLLARDADGNVYGCGYDSSSYFEDQHQKTSVAKLAPGDPLEILADHKPGSRVCYLRILHVIPPAPPRSPRREVAAASTTRPVVALPHGDRTISGVVTSISENSLTVRTRNGEETMRIRRDTVFRGDGSRVDSSALSVNERVSVRTGTSATGELEAYQVIWGDILDVP